MKKLKIGLVGCGAIAEFQMDALMKIEAAELKAVCDMRLDLAEAMAKDVYKRQIVNTVRLLFYSYHF